MAKDAEIMKWLEHSLIQGTARKLWPKGKAKDEIIHFFYYTSEGQWRCFEMLLS